MKRLLMGWIFSALACTIVWGQSTAQINGTVKDQTGAVLPGVDINATQLATGAKRSAVTDETGSYTLTSLPIGPYMVEASLPGFKTYVQTGIVLQVNSNPAINVVLEVGQVSDQIEVQADATLVETRSTGIGRVIDNQRVLELPLNGRQATELIFLSGMATPGTGAPNTSTRNYPTIQVAIAGGLSSGVSFNLDGGNINDPYNGLNLPLPFPDALQEFKVETSALPAQYGFFSSAAVNAVTKSGTNQLHGDLFEFVRNEVLNARNTFAVVRDPLKRNQFGGTIGGPIMKNKLFFFTGFQMTPLRTAPVPSKGYVPTDAMMAGDFTTITSSLCNNGKPIVLGPPFENNRISPALFSPVALGLQKLLPAPTDDCGLVPFAKQDRSNEYLIPARVDYQWSDKQSIFGRLNYSRRDQASQYDGKNALTVDVGTSPLRVYSFVLGHTYLLGSGVVSNFRANVNRANIVKNVQPFPDLNDLGVKMFLYQKKYIRVTVTNGFMVGSNVGTQAHYNTTASQFAEDLSMIRGNHQLGFGVGWIHQQLNALATVSSSTFSSFNGTVYGHGLADFLLGKPSSISTGTPGLFYYRLNFVGGYLQDSWKVTPRLTVNPGIRWEPYLPVYVEDDGISYFDRALFDQGVKSKVFLNAPAGLRFPGDEGMPGGRRVGFHRMLDFAPRLGIAWDPTGRGTTSVRAAYGIFYNRPNLTTFGDYSSAPPNGNGLSLPFPANWADPFADYPGGDPFPTKVTKDFVFPTGASYGTFSLRGKGTYQNQWNLSIQRQFGTDWLLSTTYVGTNVVHMWTTTEINPGVYIAGSCVIDGRTVNPCSTTANVNQRRVLSRANPNEGKYYALISAQDDGGTGNYHGLLLSAQRRSAKGVTISANYTWSHCIGDSISTAQSSAESIIPGDRSSSRGNCGSDRRHNFNSSTVYRTPQFSNRTLRALAGGWQVSGIVKLQSGSFFEVTSGLDRALTGAGGQLADQILGNPFMPDKTADQWLNPNAFAQPALGTYSRSRKANIPGPRSIQIDMGLTRSFDVRENQRLEFRVEAFNLPNLVNLGNPISAFNNVNFGKIQSAGDPRIMQAALKYVF